MDPLREAIEQSGGVNILGTLGFVSGDIVGGNKSIGIAPDLLPAIIASATGDWKRLTDELRQTISELEEKLGLGGSALRKSWVKPRCRASGRRLGSSRLPSTTRAS